MHFVLKYKKNHMKEGITAFYLPQVIQKYLYHTSMTHCSCFK